MTTEKANTPLQTMLDAIDIGLSLEARGHTLRVWPDALLSEAMRTELTRWKWHIMDLLELRFVMAYSETLKRTVFFAEDEAVKNALVASGAKESSIYTLEELELLTKRNRESLISAKELSLLHEAKTLFNGRFTQTAITP